MFKSNFSIADLCFQQPLYNLLFRFLHYKYFHEQCFPQESMKCWIKYNKQKQQGFKAKIFIRVWLDHREFGVYTSEWCVYSYDTLNTKKGVSCWFLFPQNTLTMEYQVELQFAFQTPLILCVIFNKAVELSLRDLGSFWHVSITHLWFHHIAKLLIARWRQWRQ